MKNFAILFALSLICVAKCGKQKLEQDLFHIKPKYEVPYNPKNSFFFETFQDEKEFKSKWVQSAHDIDKYQGEWQIEETKDNVLKGDKGLVMKSRAKHHAISSFLLEAFVFNASTFVLQYEVKLQGGLECGGCYLKLLQQQANQNLSHFHDKTPFVIMFGPDKCGTDIKVHFIFIHKKPLTGKYEEKHARSPNIRLSSKFSDGLTHLYTLVIKSDNSFIIMVDREVYVSGSLLTDMDPPVNPSEFLVDPYDRKPHNWDENELIPDPKAIRPEDWDERMGEMIVDKSAKIPDGWMEEEEELIPDRRVIKPHDWDDDIDGIWEPPLIGNPACEDVIGCGKWTPPLIRNPLFKGQWKAPLVPNPAYKGAWKPRKLRNPKYFHDPHPYNMPNISAIGIEVWSMSTDILFDNIVLLSSPTSAQTFANLTWNLKHQMEKEKKKIDSLSTIDSIVIAANERPSLWIVIILAIVLPTLLIIIICCRAPVKKLEESPKRRRYGDRRNEQNQIQNNNNTRNNTNTTTTTNNNKDNNNNNNSNNDRGQVVYRSFQGQSSLRMRSGEKE